MKPIVLDTTSKKIQLILSAAPATTQPDWVASYADANGTVFTEGSSGGTANSTTAVDIVSAPASGYRRIVSEVTIHNADIATVTATLRYNDNGTIRVIARIEIGAGNTWSMSAGFANTSVLNKVVQVVSFSTGALASGTGIIPFDNTIPQNTEGNEYMTLAITPTNALNKLYVEVIANFAVSSLVWVIGGLFRNTNASADATCISYVTYGAQLVLNYEVVAGSTSPITFKFRAGVNSSAILYLNGDNAGSSKLGGSLSSSIRITELLP